MPQAKRKRDKAETKRWFPNSEKFSLYFPCKV